MFDTAVAYLSNAFVAAAIGLTLGVLFGQKIKDFITGVPAELRSATTAFEADVKSKLALAKADVLAKVAPIVVKPPAPPIAPVSPPPPPAQPPV